MEKRKNFYELTQSLSSGFFSDKMMLLLSRITKTKELRESDIEILNLAEQFFDEVLAGYKWSENPRFNNKSLKFANSFSQAVNAVVTTFRTGESFENYIQKLKETVGEIKQNTFNIEKINYLDEFFFKYSKSELHKTDSIINKAPITISAF